MSTRREINLAAQGEALGAAFAEKLLRALPGGRAAGAGDLIDVIASQHATVSLLRQNVFDVAPDRHRSLPHSGRFVALRRLPEVHAMARTPSALAHGFLVHSDDAECAYNTTDSCAPEFERCLHSNVPVLDIGWPIEGEPKLSTKDQAGLPRAQCEVLS